MSKLFEPLAFAHGKPMHNRFMLAPLTNCQSHPDGRLSDAELRWLMMRAEGGFGLVMTCAAHVQAIGQGFPGQLGVFGEEHIEGLKRLAQAIHAHGSLALVQLHHAGNRAPKQLIGRDPVCPSDDAKTSARALSTPEVEQLVEDFAAAAKRAELAGFDGVELHGAHGYMLCQFFSQRWNRRQDAYGGSLENRSRILFEIISAIRSRCRRDFILGVRLSPERFGVVLLEMRELAQRLIADGRVDFLDLSLWDFRKEPEEPEHKGRSLMSWFTELPRRDLRMGAAGKIYTPADAEQVLAQGADFAILGRVAIVHHDYPARLAKDPAFTPLPLPVELAHLKNEGLSEPFLHYMRNFPGFIAGAG